MGRYVEKFSSDSAFDSEKLYAVAYRLAADFKAGHEVIALLSSPKESTRALLAKAMTIDPHCAGENLVALLSTADTCTLCLCALALHRLAVPATILHGFPEAALIEQELSKGKILLLVGEQDTALTLASTLHADACRIFEKKFSPAAVSLAQKQGVVIELCAL